MNKKKTHDVATLFHSMLLAYQLALRDILGTGRVVFVHPMLRNFAKINGIQLAKGQNLDITLQRLSKALKASGVVEDFRCEKLAAQKYVVYVDGCVWALKAHKVLNTKGLACPLALMVMSVVQDCSDKKVNYVDSEYLEKGTKTRIETIESEQAVTAFPHQLK